MFIANWNSQGAGTQLRAPEICATQKPTNHPGTSTLKDVWNSPRPSPALTATLQPPTERPDHFGTPKVLEPSSQVLVVPLQGADLHDSVGR